MFQKRNISRVTGTCGVILVICAALLLFMPRPAALYAQSLLGDFNLLAETTISVTVTLADGRSIVVPLDVKMTAQNRKAGAFILLDANVEQQPGMAITLEKSKTISAALQILVYQPVTATPAAVAALPTPFPTPLPTATPEPVPTLAIAQASDEITTVGQWVVASEKDKRAMALVWSQRLAAKGMISVSPERYAGELFDCVDLTLGGSVEPFGESYSILDIAALCASSMNIQ